MVTTPQLPAPLPVTMEECVWHQIPVTVLRVTGTHHPLTADHHHDPSTPNVTYDLAVVLPAWRPHVPGIVCTSNTDSLLHLILLLLFYLL